MANITALGQTAPRYAAGTSKLDMELLKLCKDTYEISNNELDSSIAEGHKMLDLYHNNQWTEAQKNVLTQRGQPVETFNVVKMLAHAMVGYFDTVANQIVVEPRHMNSSVSALVVNDAVQYVQDENDYETLRRQLQLDLLLTGLCVTHETVRDTGERDQFGRPVYEIDLERVPSWQVRIDPMARKANYSDARFEHRFKWLPEESIVETWGEAKLKGLTEYYNDLNGDKEADWFREFDATAVGRYKQWNNYQVVHSIVKYKKDYYECLWSNFTMLEKKKVTFKKNKFVYRPVKLFTPDGAGYYGSFREIEQTQYAINQAIVQIQQLINTSKAFVEDNAVDNIEEFKKTFNMVNGIVRVSDLQGVKIEDMSKDIVAQYNIIEQALVRIKAVLGVNDSFLGQAFASDSGRKVQMQSNSSASQLSILTDKIKYMNKVIGWDIVALIQQYWNANQIISVADPINGNRYIMINQPLMMPTNQVNPETGEPVMQPIFEPEEHPETGEYMTDDSGAILMTPLNNPDTDVKFSEIKLKVISAQTNNAEERNQLLLETFINGPIGQAMLQMNPAGYMQVSAMLVQESGTKHSPAIANILSQTSAMIQGGEIDPMLAMSGGDIQAIMGGALGGQGGGGNAVQGKKSQQLQVPTRFNNGGN